MTDDEKLDAHIEYQLAACGVATVRVKDARLFYFTVEMLERLLNGARERGSDRSGILIQDAKPDTEPELLS